MYTRTETRDISGPSQLQWWDGRPPSAFKDHAIFLITAASSGGSVERFFSMAGNVNDKQHALADNTRRLQCMAHFNGDTEGRLQ